jgi:glycosyltransferase involved in cell wall biosynthesis
MISSALESLIGQETAGEFSYDIIVIDDRSTDQTSEVVKDIARRSKIAIRYVLGEGKGISHARNRGIKESSGEWIAFFDDDQVADRSWLRELFLCASKTEALCAGGARFLRLSDRELSNLSPVCRLLLGEVDFGRELIKCQRKKSLPTGNIFLKRSVFDTVGLFDESLTRGGEDTELARRMQKAGLEAWYTPRAIVYHIIPPYRLKEDYLSWTSLRWGDNFAQINFLEWGLPKTILACIARIGQVLLVNTPLLLWDYLVRDEADKLGRKCLLWRAAGYAVRTLNLALPRPFLQDRFLRRLEFRKEREMFLVDSNHPQRGSG